MSVGVPDVKTGKPVKSEQGFHSSGHASSPELIELIDTINSEIVIPVHTEHPQLLQTKVGAHRQVIVPEVGVPIEVPS